MKCSPCLFFDFVIECLSSQPSQNTEQLKPGRLSPLTPFCSVMGALFSPFCLYVQTSGSEARVDPQRWTWKTSSDWYERRKQLCAGENKMMNNGRQRSFGKNICLRLWAVVCRAFSFWFLIFCILKYKITHQYFNSTCFFIVFFIRIVIYTYVCIWAFLSSI